MSDLTFRVYPPKRRGQWVVLIDDKLYGRYLGRDEAVLDAYDAAEDAKRRGHTATVEAKESSLARTS